MPHGFPQKKVRLHIGSFNIDKAFAALSISQPNDRTQFDNSRLVGKVFSLLLWCVAKPAVVGP